MLPVEWSDEAQIDLAEIQSYIEQFDQQAADKLRATIENSAVILSSMPYAFKAGRVPGTREYVAHPNYIVVYEADTRRVRVLRVIHARRMWPPTSQGNAQ